MVTVRRLEGVWNGAKHPRVDVGEVIFTFHLLYQGEMSPWPTLSWRLGVSQGGLDEGWRRGRPLLLVGRPPN